MIPIAFCSALALCLVTADAVAQRAGQSSTIRTGTVTGARSVDLNDGNAVGGALVGGAFGAALTRSSKSSSRRNRNAAIGAVLGAGAAASQRRDGRLYTVTTNEGTQIQIATEQTEIRMGDCVFVEQAGGSANIRRAAPAACAPEIEEVLADPEIAEELQEEAAECAAARQAVVDAETQEQIDLAVAKMQILCFD